MAVHATSASSATVSPVRSSLRCAIAYIHAHPGEALGCRDIAGLAGLSISQCARQFRRITGLAPHRYLLQVRVALVKTLLCESERDLVLIAADAGFADQSHMNRVFRRLTGTTPGAFRNSALMRLRGVVDPPAARDVLAEERKTRRERPVAEEVV
jgi:AraC-like DNA-binding protein